MIDYILFNGDIHHYVISSPVTTFRHSLPINVPPLGGGWQSPIENVLLLLIAWVQDEEKGQWVSEL